MMGAVLVYKRRDGLEFGNSLLFGVGLQFDDGFHVGGGLLFSSGFCCFVIDAVIYANVCLYPLLPI